MPIDPDNLGDIDPFPEHTRLKAIKEEADIIAYFLEWLPMQGWALAEESDREGEYWPIQLGIEKILAKYFDINLTTLNNEKEVLLARMRDAGEVEPVEDGD
jgi:hypothetical protein